METKTHPPLVASHGCVNTICKLTTAKPIPERITEVIGMRDNQTAWDICNP